MFCTVNSWQNTYPLLSVNTNSVSSQQQSLKLNPPSRSRFNLRQSAHVRPLVNVIQSMHWPDYITVWIITITRFQFNFLNLNRNAFVGSTRDFPAGLGLSLKSASSSLAAKWSSHRSQKVQKVKSRFQGSSRNPSTTPTPSTRWTRTLLACYLTLIGAAGLN